MLGYLNRPDADADTLVDDEDGRWLKTGDIAYADREGYYFITDRLKVRFSELAEWWRKTDFDPSIPGTYKVQRVHLSHSLSPSLRS